MTKLDIDNFFEKMKEVDKVLWNSELRFNRLNEKRMKETNNYRKKVTVLSIVLVISWFVVLFLLKPSYHEPKNIEKNFIEKKINRYESQNVY